VKTVHASDRAANLTGRYTDVSVDEYRTRNSGTNSSACGTFEAVDKYVPGWAMSLLAAVVPGIVVIRSRTRPLTEMSIRDIQIIMFLWSKVRRVRRADNLTAIYEPVI
jgi:hypothetical protein